MKKIMLMGLVVCATAIVCATTNEVVQCWSVTKSGNRCKRRAVVDERYCKQHSATRSLAKQPERCRSMTTNGVQCVAAPLPNSNYCREHSIR